MLRGWRAVLLRACEHERIQRLSVFLTGVCVCASFVASSAYFLIGFYLSACEHLKISLVLIAL